MTCKQFVLSHEKSVPSSQLIFFIKFNSGSFIRPNFFLNCLEMTFLPPNLQMRFGAGHGADTVRVLFQHQLKPEQPSSVSWISGPW